MVGVVVCRVDTDMFHAWDLADLAECACHLVQRGDLAELAHLADLHRVELRLVGAEMVLSEIATFQLGSDNVELVHRVRQARVDTRIEPVLVRLTLVVHPAEVGIVSVSETGSAAGLSRLARVRLALPLLLGLAELAQRRRHDAVLGKLA